MIRVLVAEENFLIREGLKSLLAQHPNLEIVAECEDRESMYATLKTTEVAVLLLDYGCSCFQLEDILSVQNQYPDVAILAMTERLERKVVRNALKTGLSGHVLRDCSGQEILDGLAAVARGKQFYCGTILEAIQDEEIQQQKVSCAPITLSQREIEIIQLIAEGATNKEIAARLFLSTHTVMTHRKNIMGKLGVNNTAGIVIYAVKENIISPNRFLFAAT